VRRKNLESLQHTIKAFIRKGESYYIAECLELAVVTQGKTLDETVGNLRRSCFSPPGGEDLQNSVWPQPDVDHHHEVEPLPDVA